MNDPNIIRGKDHTYYSVRIITLCIAAAAATAALIGGTVGWVVADNQKADVANTDCGLRRESNARVAENEKVRDAIVDLTTAMTRTRRAERDAFEGLGEAFDIQAQVRPLVRVLARAADEDRRIARTIQGVSFQRLSTRGC